MRSINPVFTDKEFAEIERIKIESGLNWHSFLIAAAVAYEDVEPL